MADAGPPPAASGEGAATMSEHASEPDSVAAAGASGLAPTLPAASGEGAATVSEQPSKPASLATADASAVPPAAPNDRGAAAVSEHALEPGFVAAAGASALAPHVAAASGEGAATVSEHIPEPASVAAVDAASALAPPLARVVQAKSMAGRPLFRIMGSLGIDGDGTEFEVEDIDPFILCDYAVSEGSTRLGPMPFCAHPHSGIVVSTLHFEGEPMMAWDNIGGFEAEKLRAGGVYAVWTGRGCVHDEGPAPIVTEKQHGRAPFGFPSVAPREKIRLAQLWWDAGHLHAEGPLPKARTQVVQPEAVPIVCCGDIKARLLLGTYEEHTGIDAPATVMHCGLLPFAGRGHLRLPAGKQAFLFIMSRDAVVTIGDVVYKLPEKHELIIAPQGHALDLTVEVDVPPAEDGSKAEADEPLEVLFGFGTPSGKKSYKLLGYGGALVASSEEQVRSLMMQYEKDPRNFGADPETGAVDTSRFGLQVGYKSAMDGKGECQRLDAAAPPPEARFYLVEKGPYQAKGAGKGQEGASKP